jgi:hypothetical protein
MLSIHFGQHFVSLEEVGGGERLGRGCIGLAPLISCKKKVTRL